MKKFLLILISILVLFSFGCANKTDNPDPDNGNKDEEKEKQEDKGIFSMTMDNYIINNGLIEVVINRDNGNIKSIRNLKTDRDFIEESAGGNWAMLVDTKTSNPYKTNPNLTTTYLINSRKFNPTINYEKLENGLKIEMLYDVSFKAGTVNVDGITVKSTLTFSNDSNEFSVDYEVKNNTTIDTCIYNFTSAIVSGIKDNKSELDLFWPNKEGKIYDNAVDRAFKTLKLTEQYPSPVSMQLIQLFTEDEALYYYVSDNTREYKEFNFGSFASGKGYDAGTVDIADKVSLSCTQYPFISNGQTKQLWKTVIGVSNGNSWYLGSDSYRANLINLGMKREYSKYVAEWTGFVSDTLIRYGNNIAKTYVGSNASDKVVLAADNAHVDSVVLFGWHDGGFDYKYPDYEIMEGEGFGEENFRTLISNIHANGDKVLPYVNGHITAENSEWGQKTYSGSVNNMLHAAVKKIGFSNDLDASKYTNYMYHEVYGTDVGYYATCPDCDEYVNQLLKVVEKLVDCGADGLWMDQMMEMPAVLCFDESHGHATPATAYGEGYKKLYSGIDAIFKKYNREYLIFAEGTTDAWIEYIDICAYMWGRHLHALDTANPGDGEYMHPEITAYTMPCSFLGINGYEVAYNHAYGYLMGSPLNNGTSSIDMKVNALYIDNPDIYFYGRYMDYRGLSLSNNKVLGSIIIGNENRIGIQLYNNNDKKQNVTVTVDLESLGKGDKTIIEAKDLLTGEIITIEDGKFSLDISANDIASVAIILGD